MSGGDGAQKKILDLARILSVRAELRARGRKLVQCHGCFDIVHPGHIRHLRQARSLGDRLLVSITGDTEMRKGTGRPLIPQELRAENLAALDCVDYVYVDPSPTAEALLEAVRPDVYVKGREYEFNNDPRFRAEKEAVERHGGRVVYSSGEVVFSSTALIAALEHTADPFQARLAQLTGREELQGPALFKLLSGFRGRRVVVVGEPILDSYILCDRPDVAAEGPILTLRPLEARHYDGGAAIVARHAAALGARPVLVTAMAEDGEAGAMRARLRAEGVEVRSLPIPSQVAEKQRFLVGSQKVMKIDLLTPHVLDAGQQEALIGMARDAASEGGGCDAAIIADFGLGLFSSRTIMEICAAVRRHAGILSGDVSGKRSNLRSMRGMDLLCPSEQELRDAMRLHTEGLPLVTWKLLEETSSGAAIVTLGADGLIAFGRLPGVQDDDQWRSRLSGEHLPALCPLAVDALGCGDALLTAASLSLASGGSLLAGAFLGAAGAATQVQRLGNTPVSTADLRTMIVRTHNAHLRFSGSETEARAMKMSA